MKKLTFLLMFCFLLVCSSADAYWVWSPQTNKWINPAYRVFETPEEQFEWAMGYFEEGDFRKALFEFRKVVRNYPKSRTAPEAMFYVCMCYEKIGKDYKAYLEYQNLIKTYPLTERLEEIVEKQYAIGEKFFSKKQYERARIVMAQAVTNAPYSKVSDVMQYKIGLCYLYEQDYHNSRIEFEKVVDDYGFSPYVDESTYQIALCSFKISARVKDYDEELVDKAIEDIEYYLRRYPTSDEIAEAESLLKKLRYKKAEKLFNTAYFYEKQRKSYAAVKYYEELLYDYPNTDWSKKGRDRLEKIRSRE